MIGDDNILISVSIYMNILFPCKCSNFHIRKGLIPGQVTNKINVYEGEIDLIIPDIHSIRHKIPSS